MLVKEISEQHIQDIGHAFGYYDYGEEKGMASWFRDKEAVVTYICGFVRCVLTDGFLHTTSERGEGYIAYKLPGQDSSRLIEAPVARTSLTTQPSDAFRFASAVAAYADLLRGGQRIDAWDWRDVARTARQAGGRDPHGLKAEFIELVDQARRLVAVPADAPAIAGE